MPTCKRLSLLSTSQDKFCAFLQSAYIDGSEPADD